MLGDANTRLSGSTANPPTPQSLIGATTAGLVSTNYLNLSIARAIAEGKHLMANFGFYTAVVAGAGANDTLDCRIVASPLAGTIAAVTFTVTAATDLVNSTAHGLPNGTAITVANSGGALPAGLAASTHYYVRDAATDSFKVSLTPGGAAVDITGAGTGTQSYTVIPQIIASTGPVPVARLKVGAVRRAFLNPLGGSAAGTQAEPKFKYLFGLYVPSSTLTAGAIVTDITEQIGSEEILYPPAYTML